MLFAHIADTHLGYRQFNLEERERDFYRAFHEAVDQMISEEVDVVLHAGDLFDEPRPPIRALVEAKKGIAKLKRKGVKIVMIPGNHDMIMRKGSMAPHAIFDGVNVLTLDNPFVVIDDIFIGGVPFLSKSYRDILLEKIKGLRKEAAKFKRSVLLLHQGIDKFLPHEHELSMGELPGNFSYYALGHVHARIEEEFGGGWLSYSGSTEIWRSEEAKDWEKKGKGFLLIDSDEMRPQRKSLESVRTFLKTEISTENDIELIKQKLTEHVKPVLSVTIKSEEDFNHLYERVRGELSKNTLYLTIKKQHVHREETVVKGGVVDVRELISEALQDYSEDERSFSFEAFKLLARNDIEDTIGLTEDFYEKWMKGEGLKG
jgi:DNA repair exonuclease SbcCD nuclease subunit